MTNLVLDDDYTVSDALSAESVSYGPGIYALFVTPVNGVRKPVSITVEGYGERDGEVAEALKQKLYAPDEPESGIVNEASISEVLNGKWTSTRKIWISEFNSEAKNEFINAINRFNSESMQTPIVCIVSSPGGSVFSLFAMAGIARLSLAPVYVVNLDIAASCGAIFTACAAEKGRRFGIENSTIMVHEVSVFMCGQMKLKEMKEQVKQTEKVNRQVFTFLSKNTALSVDEWAAEMQKDGESDHYYDTEESIKKGLIDAVLTPAMYEKLFIDKTESEPVAGLPPDDEGLPDVERAES